MGADGLAVANGWQGFWHSFASVFRIVARDEWAGMLVASLEGASEGERQSRLLFYLATIVACSFITLQMFIVIVIEATAVMKISDVEHEVRPATDSRLIRRK